MDKNGSQDPVSRSRKPKPSRGRHTIPRKEWNPKMLSNCVVLACGRNLLIRHSVGDGELILGFAYCVRVKPGG